MKGSFLPTLAGGEWVGATLTVLKVISCGRSRVLVNRSASNWLNRSDHFWSSSSNLWLVDVEVGWLDELDEDLVGFLVLHFLLLLSRW